MTRFETPGAVRLRVVLGAGEVSIETGEEPVVVVDVLPLRDDRASREAAAETHVEHREVGGGHELGVEVPKRWGFAKGREASVAVRIRCPHGADLVLAAASAGLDARGRLGTVRAKSASGDLALQVVEGSLDANTASGDVTLAEVLGAAKVRTASGDVEVKRVGGDLSVGLVSGDLDVGEALGAVAVSTVSGDVRIAEAGGGGIELKSVSGDVEIGMRPGLRLWIDASSVSGTMSSELDITDAKPAADGPLVELRAKSVSGDVRIRRAVAGVRS
jgi:DUF4097 and DUF4098 domain-containing protein YvlB